MWTIVYQRSREISDKLLFASYKEAYDYKLDKITSGQCGNTIETYDFVKLELFK